MTKALRIGWLSGQTVIAAAMSLAWIGTCNPEDADSETWLFLDYDRTYWGIDGPWNSFNSSCPANRKYSLDVTLMLSTHLGYADVLVVQVTSESESRNRKPAFWIWGDFLYMRNSDTVGTRSRCAHRLELPCWFVVGGLAAHPLLAFLCGPFRRWRRKRRGECIGCGYNLTGLSEGRCPECGRGIAGSPVCAAE